MNRPRLSATLAQGIRPTVAEQDPSGNLLAGLKPPPAPDFHKRYKGPGHSQLKEKLRDETFLLVNRQCQPTICTDKSLAEFH